MSLFDEPDFERDFEVTDLRTGLPDERVYRQGAERSHRRHVLGAVVTVLVVLCALLIPVINVPGFGATFRRALHLPTPTTPAQIATGADVIYFEHGLPWGTLLMDGSIVTNVDVEQPYTAFEQLYTSLRIAPGRHLLTYTASPFPPMQCWLSVPAARSDTCPLIHSRGSQDVTPPYASERVLDLGGDPGFLSPQLLASLESAANRAIAGLATSTTVLQGDIYAGATGEPQVATTRMTATLSYTVAMNPANVYIIPGSILNCAILCPIQPASYLNNPQAQWVVAAHVIPAWKYQQADGTLIPGSASPLGVLPDSIVPLAVSWDGSWHVQLADSLASSPMCFIALNLIAAEHLAGAPLSTLKMQPATNPVDGCLISGDAFDASGIPTIPFTVMYRFGLLIAVDDEAQRLLPALPVADARLRALARAWGG